MLYRRRGRSRILVGVKRSGSFLRQPFVMFLGTVLVLVGAGMAAARTQGGPPWAQEPADCETTTDTDTDTDVVLPEECETEEVGDDVVADDVVIEVDLLDDPEQVRADVEAFFSEFDNDCGSAFLGEYDLGDEDTLVAFDDLVTRLDEGQTSHMIQSVRVLLSNCEDHPNDGLMNALSHHGLNWVRHYEHEQWLQDKFAEKWPDGKPGNGGGPHGNPHELHGNPHTSSPGGSNGNGHGNANGHSS